MTSSRLLQNIRDETTGDTYKVTKLGMLNTLVPSELLWGACSASWCYSMLCMLPVNVWDLQ